MKFKAQPRISRCGKKTLWVTFWCYGQRCGSLILDEQQLQVMLDLLKWHCETDAPGNWIDNEQNGLRFVSEGNGDIFAIGASEANLEISVPYRFCQTFLEVVQKGYEELLHPREHGCDDCGIARYQMFIVTKPLWNQYGNGSGELCLPCFEKRLGRKLRPEDFETVWSGNLDAYRDDPICRDRIGEQLGQELEQLLLLCLS